MDTTQTTTEIAPGITGFTTPVSVGRAMRMDTTSLAIKLADDSILLHSPSLLSRADYDTVDRLGAVRHIVAPNLFHHLGLPAAIARWPEATVWAPPGLTRKYAELGEHRVLGERGTTGEWPADIAALEVAGMPKFREWVFWHPASQTLVVTDLFFHQPVGHTWLSRLLLRVTGADSGECSVSRLFRSMIKDRAAFAQSCAAILALPFERIVMAHGAVIEHDAKGQATRALAAFLD